MNSFDNKKDNQSPLVSVCCTTYNLENYVAKSIDSILEQETDFDYEIIVHDDASTDGTQEIIQSYVDQYPDVIKPVFQQQNIYSTQEGGLGVIFKNHILPNTRGKYLAIMDGDDYWLDPHKLQKQVDYLERNQQCSACVANSIIKNELTNYKRLYNKKAVNGILPEFQVVIRGGAIYPTSTLMFNREKFTSSPLLDYYTDLSKYYRIDTLLIYCLIFVGKIGYLDEITAVYRRWEGGLFSGIMNDYDKISAMKEKEIRGNKSLVKLLSDRRKNLFKRKISVDALYVLRRKSGVKKYRHFFNLKGKELIKYVLRIQ